MFELYVIIGLACVFAINTGRILWEYADMEDSLEDDE